MSKNKEMFIEDSRFAKIVTDSNGESAILIGGSVISLRSSDPEFHVDCLVSALRRPHLETDYLVSESNQQGISSL